MKVTYDAEADAAYIRLNKRKVEQTTEPWPGVIVDYDDDGNPVGFEILDASKRMDNPRSVELEMLAATTKTVKKPKKPSR